MIVVDWVKNFSHLFGWTSNAILGNAIFIIILNMEKNLWV